MRGPAVYRIPGVETQLAAAAGILQPTNGDPVRFVFPRPLVVEGIFLMPLSGSAADAACLNLGIEDEFGVSIGTDGRFSELIPALAMVGQGWRWFPLHRPIAQSGKMWVFRTQNTSLANAITPRCLLRIGDP